MMKSYFLEAALWLSLIAFPAKSYAVSPACANFSVSSFQGQGGASGAFVNYVTGPFFSGDQITIGVGAVFPAYQGPLPNDAFGLVDADGNLLAGPQRDLSQRLTLEINHTVSAIGLKNLGEDFIFVDFAACAAAPATVAAPAASDPYLVILAILVSLLAAANLNRSKSLA